MNTIDTSTIDWKTYYEKGKASLARELEENTEMWDRWTKPEEQYLLVTEISLIENSFNKSTGRVTSHYNTYISSNSVEDLENIWSNFISKRPYDTAKQHFIADIKNRKIIKFVSVCM